MTVPSSERVVFSSVFEALSKIVVNKAPQLVDPLRSVEVDVHRLNPAYPVETWKAATALVAQTLYPELPAAEAQYHLGREITLEFGHTLVGRALMATLRLLGPRRTFSRVSRSFRTANNYIEDRVTEHGPADFELWLNEAHVPHINQGVMQAALELVGAKQCTVEVTHQDENGATYRARWL